MSPSSIRGKCDGWGHDVSLTPSIPFSAGHDNSFSVKRYLENLLPEGAGLDVVAQTNRLSKSNVFGLMRAIGQESAGAMLILPEGGELVATAEPDRQRRCPRKNLSFYMRSRGKIAFSPAYDLVSTVAYNGIEDALAMGIGDVFQFKEIGAFQWACFAQECRIPQRLLSNEMKIMAALVTKHSAATDLTQFTAEERADILRIQNYIVGQSETLMKDAALVVDVLVDGCH